MSLCDVFVKLGGSILDEETSTAALVPQLTALSREYRISILTGGGQTVKRIKANQMSHSTDFHGCWKAGVLCLEVNANLLASYSRTFSVVSCAADLLTCFESGRIAILAPAGAILSS